MKRRTRLRDAGLRARVLVDAQTAPALHKLLLTAGNGPGLPFKLVASTNLGFSLSFTGGFMSMLLELCFKSIAPPYATPLPLRAPKPGCPWTFDDDAAPTSLELLSV